MKRSVVLVCAVCAVLLMFTGCLPVYYAGESSMMQQETAQPESSDMSEKVESPEPVPEQSVLDEPEVVYELGATGPAGGLVVIDMGDYSRGWRFIEIAPVETELNGVKWVPGGFYTEITQTDVSIGSGFENTRQIIRVVGSSPSEEYAALVCDRLSYGGYDDWYLPSRDTFVEIEKYLADQDHWDLLDSWPFKQYWSSSEAGNPTAWTVSVPGGSTSDSAKGFLSDVRAVRRF
jgi:hypothetical protein